MKPRIFQDRIKNYLEEKGKVDTIKAKELIGNARFSAIIHRLRQRGYKILTTSEQMEGFRNVTYTLIRKPIVKEIKRII